MANSVFLVYKDTAENTVQAAELTAVCSSFRTAVSFALNYLMQNNIIKSDDMLAYKTELINTQQTQNISIIETPLNKLIINN
jgi:hypothetical protein